MIPLNSNAINNIINDEIKIKKILKALNITEYILVFFIIIIFYLTLPLNTTKVLHVPKGSTSDIVSYLDKSGFQLNIIDNITLRVLGYVQSGWINIGSNRLSKWDFLYRLTTSKAALKNVTLVPGETYFFFIKQLSKELNLSEEKLTEVYKQYAYKEDGNIIADTYSLPMGMNEDHLLFYLFSQTNKKYEAFSKKVFGYYDKRKWYYFLTIASIIQKEAASNDEMPVVSSVIHNRIKNNMPLQMDGSLNYGEFSHTKITAKMIESNTTSYNTYKNKSLPEHPVCAVDFNAIKAAMFPVKSEYLYFVKDKNSGVHKFSKSYVNHKENIKSNQNNKKTTTSKTNEKEQQINKQAKEIMKKDFAEQKNESIKKIFHKID